MMLMVFHASLYMYVCKPQPHTNHKNPPNPTRIGITTQGKRVVCSLSLGAAYNQLVNDAVSALVNTGVVPVVAAGNSNIVRGPCLWEAISRIYDPDAYLCPVSFTRPHLKPDNRTPPTPRPPPWPRLSRWGPPGRRTPRSPIPTGAMWWTSTRRGGSECVVCLRVVVCLWLLGREAGGGEGGGVYMVIERT